MRAYADGVILLSARNATTDHFPLHAEKGQASSAPQACKEAERPLRAFKTANDIRADEDVLRPGEQYAIYNTQDILGSLPEDLEFVIGAAARWAGVESTYVLGVVERFERRIARWWDTTRRKERGEAADDTTE